MNAKALSLIAAAIATSAALGADDAVKLTLVPKGGSAKVGYYNPQRVTLSDKKPDTLKKAPEGLTAPRYGTLTLAGPDKAVYHLILDEPDGKPSRLFVDSNGNGDLTDDEAAEWTAKEA